MRYATFNSFFSELKKVAGRPPPASMALALRKQAGIAANAVGAVKAFKRPIQNMGVGWNAGYSGEVGRGGWLGSKGVWQDLPVGPKTLTTVGTGLMVPDALKKDDPAHKGRSKLHRAMNLAGNTAGGLVGATHGMTGALVGSGIGYAGGHLLGKTVDALRHYRPAEAAGSNVIRATAQQRFNPGVSE